MIKFFRKIRQKMLTENKFGKYLMYAIGEIVLVVIGILIALQLNQWNENKKADIDLQILTKNLHFEFTNNYQELEVDLTRLKRKVLAGKTLLSYTGIKNIPITEFKIDSLIFEAIEIPTWNPSSFVLNDIKNSGKLSALKSTKLKQLLYNWERLYEDLIEWQSSLEESGKGLIDVINNKGSIINVDFYNQDSAKKSKFKMNNTNLLQEIHFENILETNQFAARGLAKKYIEAKILLNEIIEVSKNNSVEKK
jgi:hypothetical protein